ncbi:U3 small nucleolar RNA-associated protein 14 homolog A [Microcaecilia unicolor]|uniref:U3 small nucleolar RNA-associated protein 14 homolog A n=1 Tax=Microcaecilia unicolor TaxID=1415580 RepID=A0A6P7YKM8_9AMPH|nr:U3 small nucleolar RNA-associated protein 14 homolog A [Microcaecilia unicolor]XP_030065362.1 U3 small nucleolar RNA-associated protein 14 homolog A [Microcaecilia unicolor]
MAKEEDLFYSEHPVSASEDEGDSDEERKHRKLLEAIGSLDGKKRRKLGERTEASLQVSEFSVSSEGANNKIELSELLQPIKASSSLVTLKKQLNKVKHNAAVELPLSKEETQRIQRQVAYEKASKDITKWDRIVLQNREADQLVFPLNQEQLAVKPIEEVLTTWKARTPLEQEIFNILHKNKQPVTDPLLTPLEEASLKAMSLEEAKLRRAELQKARALQSYYEAKARRAKKIKSKKYHRVQKKGKQKEALKEFETLKMKNPEAALEELQKMERVRIEERMSLKHQNSGKWARSKAIMAKYDQEARRAMQEQLDKNKELTQKLQVVSDSDEAQVEEETLVPASINEVQVSTDSSNPWMLGKLRSDAKDSGIEEELQEPPILSNAGTKNMMEEEEELSEEETLLQEFEERRHLRKQQQKEEDREVEQSSGEMDPDKRQTSDLEDDKKDEQILDSEDIFQNLLNHNGQPDELGRSPTCAMESDANGLEKIADEPSVREEGPFLAEQLQRAQTMEEVGALGREEWAGGEEVQTDAVTREEEQQTMITVPEEKKNKRKKNSLINLKRVLSSSSRTIKTPALPTAVEEEEEEEGNQKLIIKEAFAGDDVIKDFLKEKRSSEQAGKPKNIDLTLPGWGEWGGTGLKPSTKKRKRFLIRATPGPPRKDHKLPNVIINEKRDLLAAAHQVNELPFPFNNCRQFQSSIRAPIGATWNTQRAFQRLTTPHVITKQGHIIAAMTDEDAFQSTQAAQQAKPAYSLNPQKPRTRRKPADAPQPLSSSAKEARRFSASSGASSTAVSCHRTFSGKGWRECDCA